MTSGAPDGRPTSRSDPQARRRLSRARLSRLRSCASLGPLLVRAAVRRAAAAVAARAARKRAKTRGLGAALLDGHPLQLLGGFRQYRPAHGTVTVLPLRGQASGVFTRHEAHVYDDADIYHDALNFGWCAHVHVFLVRDSGALDDALSRAAVATAAVGPGLRVSNRGGFHSDRTWLQRLTASRHSDVAAAARQLLHAVSLAIHLAEAHTHGDHADGAPPPPPPPPPPGRAREPHDSWCNVVGEGHYHGLHDHEGNSWSGVYYAAVPPSVQGRSGALVMRTATSVVPHPGADGEWCTYAAFTPQPGALVLFPGWLPHAVLPLRSEPSQCASGLEGRSLRISISFNEGSLAAL